MTPPYSIRNDEDGTVLLLTDHVDEAELPAVRKAVQICPSRALSLAPEAVDTK